MRRRSASKDSKKSEEVYPTLPSKSGGGGGSGGKSKRTANTNKSSRRAPYKKAEAHVVTLQDIATRSAKSSPPPPPPPPATPLSSSVSHDTEERGVAAVSAQFAEEINRQTVQDVLFLKREALKTKATLMQNPVYTFVLLIKAKTNKEMRELWDDTGLDIEALMKQAMASITDIRHDRPAGVGAATAAAIEEDQFLYAEAKSTERGDRVRKTIGEFSMFAGKHPDDRLVRAVKIDALTQFLRNPANDDARFADLFHLYQRASQSLARLKELLPSTKGARSAEVEQAIKQNEDELTHTYNDIVSFLKTGSDGGGGGGEEEDTGNIYRRLKAIEEQVDVAEGVVRENVARRPVEARELAAKLKQQRLNIKRVKEALDAMGEGDALDCEEMVALAERRMDEVAVTQRELDKSRVKLDWFTRADNTQQAQAQWAMELVNAESMQAMSVTLWAQIDHGYQNITAQVPSLSHVPIEKFITTPDVRNKFADYVAYWWVYSEMLNPAWKSRYVNRGVRQNLERLIQQALLYFKYHVRYVNGRLEVRPPATSAAGLSGPTAYIPASARRNDWRWSDYEDFIARPDWASPLLIGGYKHPYEYNR